MVGKTTVARNREAGVTANVLPGNMRSHLKRYQELYALRVSDQVRETNTQLLRV